MLKRASKGCLDLLTKGRLRIVGKSVILTSLIGEFGLKKELRTTDKTVLMALKRLRFISVQKHPDRAIHILFNANSIYFVAREREKLIKFVHELLLGV
jgi:hypothetical protein